MRLSPNPPFHHLLRHAAGYGFARPALRIQILAFTEPAFGLDFTGPINAKETRIIDAYDLNLKLNRFELLIDWGWFHFITKPLFLAMDWIYQKVGNFGVAILIVTVLIKILFFPLANKSYASMAKMKAVQPEMMAIRERYGDDKVKQQQALIQQSVIMCKHGAKIELIGNIKALFARKPASKT